MTRAKSMLRRAKSVLRLLGRPNAPLRVSLREHLQRVRRRGFVLIVTGVGGVLGLISLTVPASPGHAFVPTWLWVGLLVGGIVFAQFLSFHEVRLERDEAKAEVVRRFDLLRYRFEMVGLACPQIRHIHDDGKAEWGYAPDFQFFNGGQEPLEFEVERGFVEIGGASKTLEGGERGNILLPGQVRSYRLGWIPSPIPLDEGVVPPGGRGEYSVLYGHPSGGQRFRTRQEFQLNWVTSSERPMPVAHWTTLGKITHEPA